MQTGSFDRKVALADLVQNPGLAPVELRRFETANSDPWLRVMANKRLNV